MTFVERLRVLVSDWNQPPSGMKKHGLALGHGYLVFLRTILQHRSFLSTQYFSSVFSSQYHTVYPMMLRFHQSFKNTVGRPRRKMRLHTPYAPAAMSISVSILYCIAGSRRLAVIVQMTLQTTNARSLSVPNRIGTWADSFVSILISFPETFDVSGDRGTFDVQRP